MASRKRTRRPLGPARRKRRSLRPLLENLENRLVLSQGNSLLPSGLASLAGSSAASWLAPEPGRVPVPLANGGTAWLQAPGALGLGLPSSSGSSHGTTPPLQPPSPSDAGAILGRLPVASPFASGGSDQTPGPAGYVPLQIQTAYGLSNGSGYNTTIAFGGIKGDGSGQTIAIFEAGSNPAFVGTSSPNYSTSALAVFDRTFGLPDPPSLAFYDQNGNPITASNPGPGNLGAGTEIALDIEWAHAMAPGARIDVINDDFSSYDAVFQGVAAAIKLPGVSVVTISYGFLLEFSGNGAFEQSLDSTYLAPALAAHPNVSVYAASGDNGASPYYSL
ncbi:MAG TPA: hypothetical protein VFF52_06900, partial [Isosphaeraceae bacterium]|nr:hypothetical protein [Isosphaeraceae bacterium]